MRSRVGLLLVMLALAASGCSQAPPVDIDSMPAPPPPRAAIDMARRFGLTVTEGVGTTDTVIPAHPGHPWNRDLEAASRAGFSLKPYLGKPVTVDTLRLSDVYRAGSGSKMTTGPLTIQLVRVDDRYVGGWLVMGKDRDGWLPAPGVLAMSSPDVSRTAAP